VVLELQIKIIGYGFLKKYSRGEYRPGSYAEIKNVLNELGVKAELQESILILKNGKVSSVSEELQDGDVLELFVLLCGG